MKSTLLLFAGLSAATLGYAQTTPATGTTTPAASGTKNVGADRADAPQAPGMSSTASTQAAARPTKQPASRKMAPAKAKRP